MLSTVFKLGLLGGVAVVGAQVFAPSTVAAAITAIVGPASFTAESCLASPDACFEAKERNLKGAQAKLQSGRAQADVGLRALELEESKQRELLEANTGLQAILRAKATEMIRVNTSGITFQGRPYTRTDVEQQASLMAREEAAFRSSIAEFQVRRQRLTEARMSAIVEGNRVNSALATLTAEKALMVASGSLDGARRLLEETTLVERRAGEVSDVVVRSTREMAVLPVVASQPSAGGFDFSLWLTGLSTEAR